MVCRYTAETRSAAPPTAKSATASHSELAKPDAATARPQTTMATTSATPCRWTRRIHPDDSPATEEPIATAANSQPTAPCPPNRSSAAWGNSARGMASTIATMSTANDIRSTGRVQMKARPSTTERSPGTLGRSDSLEGEGEGEGEAEGEGEGEECSGGSDGSRR